MVRLLFAVALTALAGCYTSEGSGTVAIATYDLADFTAVSLSGHGKAIIEPGAFAVSASADDDVLPSIRIERHGDTLVLGRDVDWIDGVRPSVPVEFRVVMPALAAVNVSGSGTAAIRGWSAADLRLSVSGAGQIDAADVRADSAALVVRGAGTIFATGLQAEAMTCEMSGSGRMTTAGEAQHVAIELSGSSLYRGSRLRAAQISVAVQGAGQAFVWADERLEARINGTGRVLYRGEPAVTTSLQREGAVIALDAAGGNRAHAAGSRTP